MAEKNDAFSVAKRLKHDEPDKKIPVKEYDNYIKDADQNATPRGGQERRV